MVKLNGRDVDNAEHGISFKTPEAWLHSPRIRRDYRDVVFERQRAGDKPVGILGGVGHVLLDEALQQARNQDTCVTELPSELWPSPMLVFRITDRVTTTGSTVRAVVVAVTRNTKGEFEIWPDWRLIVRLNELLERRTMRRDKPPLRTDTPEVVEAFLTQATEFLQGQWKHLDLSFAHPEATCISLFGSSSG